MADWESKLLAKAVQYNKIEKLISYGIETRHFEEEENRKLWEYLNNHVKKYKESPSFDAVKEKFPDYKFETVKDNIEFLKDKFLVEVKRREAVKAVYDLGELLDENRDRDLSKIDEIFLDKARDLSQIIPSSKVSKFSSMKERIAAYKERKKSDEPPGMLFGIPSLDEHTLGLQKHEYVTIAGPTGMGKTTLGLLFALNHYLDDKTPMIISLEMDEDEIYRKLDAMAVGMKQQALKGMTLPYKDMERWEKYAEKIETLPKDIVVVDVWDATPEKIYAETSRWSPDMVVVDYIQLLRAPNHLKQSWERIGYVSQSMKQISRQLRIPVYGLAQTNTDSYEEGATLANVAQSREIGRHSDIFLGLHQDEEMMAMNKLELRLLKNRGGPKATIDMYFDHENAEYREWRPDDAYLKKY